MACRHSFVAMGQAKKSMFPALLRKVVLLIPMIMILLLLFPGRETSAVFLAEPVCGTIAAATTSIAFLSGSVPAAGKRA